MERGHYSRLLLYFKPRLASRTASLIGNGSRVRSNTRSKSVSGPSCFSPPRNPPAPVVSDRRDLTHGTTFIQRQLYFRLQPPIFFSFPVVIPGVLAATILPSGCWMKS